jgi:hypothetical protein
MGRVLGTISWRRVFFSIAIAIGGVCAVAGLADTAIAQTPPRPDMSPSVSTARQFWRQMSDRRDLREFPHAASQDVTEPLERVTRRTSSQDDEDQDWLISPESRQRAEELRPVADTPDDDLLGPAPVNSTSQDSDNLLSPARLPKPGELPRRSANPDTPVSRLPADDDDDDLLSPPTSPSAPPTTAETDPDTPAPDDSRQEPNASVSTIDGKDPHWELFAKNAYPSAKECAPCHEQIYREWSVSSHAYASISPMFQKFEQKINDLSQGTIGYFCLRCHAPVATDMGVPRDANIWQTIPAAHEGVTCIACHRVVERYGRVNGERRIEHGSVFDPVVSSGNGQKVHDVIAKKDYYKVKTSPDEKGPGTPIHNGVIQFDHVSSSHFCVSCHQVAVFPGIKLEVVWEQYRASPACKSGIRCQDCHMGAVPGQAAGFEIGPAAIVNDKPINPHRRHSNHMFVGPGYSIAHPGTFPLHPKGDRWTVEEWLLFDWRAGWGTDRFEDNLKDDAKNCFPEVWANVDDRYDAREIIDANIKLLEWKDTQRSILMEGSSKVLGPFFKRPPRAGEPLKFHYRVTNLNSGHNMPSGSLGAQPQIWLNVTLTGPQGEWLWESGYVDANGDMADLHSLEVAAGRIRRDTQLFNLQTKFLITGVKGTDREMYLPINVDFDQLPFLRPSGFPITTLNHPPFIRMEAHSLTPLGTRKAAYHVPAELMRQPGRYRLSVRMRSRAEPIYFMRFCGATPEMERQMNERMLNFHQEAFEFLVR